MTEDKLQYECIKWANDNLPKTRILLYHVPNGGYRTKKEGAKFAAIGVKPGVADLHLDVPNGMYHGLKMELKTEKGKLSASQEKYRDEVTAAGYKYVLIKTVDQFKHEMFDYLKYTNYI